MCFLVKKSIDKTKKYFVSNQNLTTEHVKIVINSRLFKVHIFWSIFSLKLSLTKKHVLKGTVKLL